MSDYLPFDKPAYRLGVYAVVVRGKRALLVQYTGGRAGLPGTVHEDPQAPLEDVLRSAIHQQSGVAVDRFELLGSYAFSTEAGEPQLNIVFLTEYVSGALGSASRAVAAADWVSLVELRWHPQAGPLTHEAARRAAELLVQR